MTNEDSSPSAMSDVRLKMIENMKKHTWEEDDKNIGICWFVPIQEEIRGYILSDYTGIGVDDLARFRVEMERSARSRLVSIAATAIAGIESIDRRAARDFNETYDSIPWDVR